MADWGLDVEIETWEGAIHGQLNMAAQFGPAEVDPVATEHVKSYFADIVAMIEREVAEPEGFGNEEAQFLFEISRETRTKLLQMLLELLLLMVYALLLLIVYALLYKT